MNHSDSALELARRFMLDGGIESIGAVCLLKRAVGAKFSSVDAFGATQNIFDYELDDWFEPGQSQTPAPRCLIPRVGDRQHRRARREPTPGTFTHRNSECHLGSRTRRIDRVWPDVAGPSPSIGTTQLPLESSHRPVTRLHRWLDLRLLSSFHGMGRPALCVFILAITAAVVGVAVVLCLIRHIGHCCRCCDGVELACARLG